MLFTVHHPNTAPPLKVNMAYKKMKINSVLVAAARNLFVNLSKQTVHLSVM